MEDEIKVTVIATGFGGMNGESAAKTVPSVSATPAQTAAAAKAESESSYVGTFNVGGRTATQTPEVPTSAPTAKPQPHVEEDSTFTDIMSIFGRK